MLLSRVFRRCITIRIPGEFRDIPARLRRV